MCVSSADLLPLASCDLDLPFFSLGRATRIGDPMQSSVDFVDALTSEPPLDFVTALSAEQGCDVCHELHAMVDELRCHECEAAICPDCAVLRPDAQWACLTCDENHPMRVYKSRGGRGGPRSGLRSRARVGAQAANEALRSAFAQTTPRMRVALARASVVASSRTRGLRLAVAKASPRVRAALARARPLLRRRIGRAKWKAQAVLTRARESWAALMVMLASIASAAEQRGRLGLRASSAGAQRSLRLLAQASRVSSARGQQLAVVGVAGLGRGGIEVWAASRRTGSAAAGHARANGARLLEHGLVLRQRTVQGSLMVRRAGVDAAERTRAALVQTWLVMRSLPVRHHATALLLASLILFAVARADSRDA